MIIENPEIKANGANMGPIWGRQDPGGPHVGPINFAIWDGMDREWLKDYEIIHTVHYEDLLPFKIIMLLYENIATLLMAALRNVSSRLSPLHGHCIVCDSNTV